MDFFIVRDGTLIEYERIGECNRCGKCCCSNTITFKLGAYTEARLGSSDEIEDHDWSEYEGYSIFRSQGMLWYMEATVKEETKICLDLDGNACTIWMQDDFPAICRYWPVHPDNLKYFPDCGFSFEEVRN